MTTFRILAEVLAEKNYFDLDEIEKIVEVYFKLWLSDLKDKGIEDDIIKRRNLYLSQKAQIDIQRSIIERQLLEAKSRLREGESVDTAWMARANLAFRIKKSQLVHIQDMLTQLKSIEKKRNILLHQNEKELLCSYLIKFLRSEFGDNTTEALLKEFEESALPANRNEAHEVISDLLESNIESFRSRIQIS